MPSLLEIVALAIGIPASLATIAAFFGLRPPFKRLKSPGMARRDAVVLLTESNGLEINWSDFLREWAAFLQKHYPNALAPGTHAIPVANEKAQFENLRYKDGFDAMLRQLPGARTDTMQVTKRFREANRHLFEWVSVQRNGARVNGVRLKQTPADKEAPFSSQTN